MANFGGPELIVLLVVVVLLFGARKLPELGSSVGKSITNFKRGMREAQDEDDEESKPVGTTSSSNDSA